MAIRASSSKTVDSLLADLASDSPVTRESAIARLTIVGPRALDRLLALVANTRAPARARAGAFVALEGIGDPRALEPALKALAREQAEVGVAAVQLARGFLNSPHGVEVLDRLTALALDGERETALRLAAIQAVSTLPQATMKPLMAALKDDPDPDIAAAVEPRQKTKAVNSGDYLTGAAQGKLRGDAAALRRAIARAPKDLPAETVHQLIEHLRVREGAEAPAARDGWKAARAAAHLLLAERGSRLAIYDLRETIESAKGPVAVEFVAAMKSIGDQSCLEPIAAAYARASGSESDMWRRHLADAFRTLAEREGVTRRHAIAKKIEKRWPKLLNALNEPEPAAWKLTPSE